MLFCKIFSALLALCLFLVTLIGKWYSGLDHYSPFRLRLLPENSEGKCLDGSPNGYYFSENKKSKNHIFYFDGGGFCNGTTVNDTIESCYNRSLTKMGSSTDWPSYISILEASNFGILNHN